MIEIVSTEYPTTKNFTDHSGEVINGIKILRYEGRDNHRQSVYECECPYCGNTFITKYNRLSRNDVKSCGCYKSKTEIANSKYNTLINTTINDLTIIGFHREKLRGDTEIYLDCECRCGNPVSKLSWYILSGKTKCCAECDSRKRAHQARLRSIKQRDKYVIPEDILSHIGETINSLLITDCVHTIIDGHGHNFYKCICECGAECEIEAWRVLNNITRMCKDCAKKYVSKRIIDANTTHGLSKSRLYKIFSGMKYRCYSPKSSRWKSYGGKGIIICDEWLNEENGFLNFYNWAMSNGYDDTLTIDRKDVNGNYEPSNCRWVTRAEQSRNKSDNVYITLVQHFDDKSIKYTFTQSTWSKITGLSIDCIIRRLTHKLHPWSVEKTLTTDSRGNPIILNIGPYLDLNRPEKYEKSIHD